MNDNTLDQQARSNMCKLIGLLEAKVKKLEAATDKWMAVAIDMTAQRDAWRTTASELEQQPERLKTVESSGVDDYNTCDRCGTIVIASDEAICNECKTEPPALTDEMVLLLEMLIENPIHAMYEATLDSYQRLLAMGYMSCINESIAKYIYQITTAGRAALAAYRASHESGDEP